MIAGNGDEVVFPRRQLLGVILAGPAAEHAAGGDDHARVLPLCDLPPHFRVGHRLDPLAEKNLSLSPHPLGQPLRQVVGVEPVNSANLPHHAVNPYLTLGENSLIHRSLKDHDHFLSPSQGEGRDQHFSSGGYRLFHCFHQAQLFSLSVSVKLVAVGGFKDGHIRPQFPYGGASHSMLPGKRNIAGEKKRSLGAFKLHGSCAQNMARLIKRQLNPAVRHREVRLRRITDYAFEHQLYVFFRIDGNLLFLSHDLEAVVEQRPHQILSGVGHEDWSLGIFPTDNGQSAAVVQMRVTEHDGVYPAMLLDQSEVRQGVFGIAHSDAAVQKDPLSFRLHQIAAGAYLTGAAAKSYPQSKITSPLILA